MSSSRIAASKDFERTRELDRRALKLIAAGFDIATAYRKAMEQCVKTKSA